MDAKNEPQKLSIKIKNNNEVRTIGTKESKLKELISTPSKKVDGDILKKFAVTPSSKLKNVEKKKVVEKKGKRLATQESTQARINYATKQMIQEVKKEKKVENPLLNAMDYNMQFIPPKGISIDELNDFEKIFYSFFKRVAGQYVNSIHSTVTSLTSDKPYLESKLRSHPPAILTAMIRYDSEGNAEVIKILKSSNDDDVHKLFEEALKKMNKIPNIAKELKDEDGKYTAFFQLSINNSSRY
ncbi:hypothetical protein M900_2507 [Bacteriovorax sp. Seq25_V]|nr:hypothetical protein M900_2507 [Bacteriovorax sp. Seq25_V]